jgi:hypothetical protein
MATTKTKTVLTPEASAIEQNEAAKAALILADEKTNRLSLAVDEADLGMDSITDGWDQGDEITASAADYSLAAIEFKRATALHEAAQRSAQAIQQSIINTDTTLASVIAPYVKATHPDYGDVGISFLVPTQVPDQNRPYATVVQSKPVKVGQGGSMSGQVDIVLLRKSFHVGLDSLKIEQAALHDGISLSITKYATGTPQGDYVKDVLNVIAANAHSAVPVIDINPSPTMARHFADGLAQALCHSTRSTTDSPIQAVSGGGYRSAVATVEATNGSIVHIDTDPNGKRFTKAEASLKWTTPNARKPQTTMETHLRRIMAEQDGIFAPGLGVVTDAEVVSMEFANPLGESEATVRVVFASASR